MEGLPRRPEGVLLMGGDQQSVCSSPISPVRPDHDRSHWTGNGGDSHHNFQINRRLVYANRALIGIPFTSFQEYHRATDPADL
jgi:hypothetical protein